MNFRKLEKGLLWKAPLIRQYELLISALLSLAHWVFPLDLNQEYMRQNIVPCGHLQAAKDNYRRLYEITESSGWTQVEDLAPGGRDKSNKSLHLTLPHYLYTLYTHMHTQPVKWQWDCWNLASFPVPVCKRRSKRERKQMFNQFTSDRERKRPLEWLWQNWSHISHIHSLAEAFEPC